MQRASQFLRQHVVALLVLTLVVGGGAAFAAGTKLPKNSVASKQVKNNSLKGKDLKNKSVTGKDLKDGRVGAADLAADAADEVKAFYYSGGGTVTVWEKPGLAKATFALSCAPDYNVSTSVALSLSPGRAGTYGVEDIKAPGEAAASTPLAGAATVSRLFDVGEPVGGAGFGGGPFGFGHVVMFFQTPKVDVLIDIKVSICDARGTISIDHKPQGSTITRPARGQLKVECEATGVAYCKQAA